MEKQYRNSGEELVLARFNSISAKNQFENFFFLLLPFVFIHLIVYSKVSYHPWWIYLISVSIWLFYLVSLSKKEIRFLGNKKVVISRMIGSERIYKFEHLYFHKSIGGARSTYYKLIILRNKKNDSFVFRIPLDSDTEEVEVISFLVQKCGIIQRRW